MRPASNPPCTHNHGRNHGRNGHSQTSLRYTTSCAAHRHLTLQLLWEEYRAANGAGPLPQRVYRLYDFTKAQIILPDKAYCVVGKVNSADKLYLVIESIRPDAKHAQSSNAPVPADGAGRSAMH